MPQRLPLKAAAGMEQAAAGASQGLGVRALAAAAGVVEVAGSGEVEGSGEVVEVVEVVEVGGNCGSQSQSLQVSPLRRCMTYLNCHHHLQCHHLQWHHLQCHNL